MIIIYRMINVKTTRDLIIFNGKDSKAFKSPRVEEVEETDDLLGLGEALTAEVPVVGEDGDEEEADEA